MKDTNQGEIHALTILPQGDKLEAEDRDNLFRFLVSHGYRIPSACGGMGTCGKCRVLIHGELMPPTESERVYLSPTELDRGWRLACQQQIHRDMALELPQIDETTRAKELLKQELDVVLEPGVEKIYLQLPSPGKDDQRPDTVRLQEGLGVYQLTFPLPVLRKVPHLLRESEFKLTLTKEDTKILDLEPANTTGDLYGLAVDIGTTTLAAYLLDLNTGRELAVRSRMNSQKSFGADVISRIKLVHEQGETGLKELQDAVVSGINILIRQLCQAANIEPNHIYKVTVAGNPTMLQLFTAIDPSQIDHSPYIPVLRDGLVLPAEELGLEVNPRARIYVLPAVSGYVGADIMAGVLFTGLHQSDKLSLFVDIGTNAEIVLGNRENMLACSTPAGPAFEGAAIKYGMSAIPGAIAHVSLNNSSEPELDIIGGGVPKGVCGSGLIDLGAELRNVGLINKRGNLLHQAGLPFTERVTLGERNQPQFQISGGDRPIYLTQQDIRELQLAKGAVQSGVEIILRKWGATAKDVDVVYLAGAFGNYIRRESVLRIGMLPSFPLEKIIPVGNAAGQGAKLCLLNTGKWDEVQALAERVEYFELSYYKAFSDVFVQSMYFPEEMQKEDQWAK